MNLLSKMGVILLTIIPTMQKNNQGVEKEKILERGGCHQEYDYIGELPVTVCGSWTEYPDTTYEISHSSKIYREWLSNVTYTSKARQDTAEGVADYYYPTKIDGTSARGNVEYITEFTYASSISATYTTVETTRTSWGFSISLGSFGKTIQKGLQKNSFTLPSIGFSVGVDDYTETTKQITKTYKNPNSNYQFTIAKFDIYIPIKVLTYNYYGPGSYIYKEDFIFYKIHTADFIVASNNYYKDPFGKRGNITYPISVADSLKNDVLPMFFNLFDYYTK